jgi:glycosyltransferase involved in cell wall biosynthesis
MDKSSVKKIRLLIIAFSDSIHTARWIGQLDREKYEVHLFPSVPFRQLHPLIQNVTVWQLTQMENDDSKGLVFKNPSILFKAVEKLTGESIAQRITARSKSIIQKALRKVNGFVRPDIIHSMETQKAGYLVSEIMNRNNKSGWVHSTWGIDLQYFMRYPDHKEQMKRLMSQVNVLIAEGERDVNIAHELGFRNKATIIPSVGGSPDFELFDSLDSGIPPSSRNKIILKGYEGHGRYASAVLKAMRRINTQLKDYEVIIYSCSKDLLPVVREIQNGKEFNLKVTDELEYRDLLLTTTRARISITNNLFDGVPNTMLEAMAFGSFPIQSNTAITEGWIDDGINGILTIPTDENNIAAAITKALSDDLLVDKAAAYNRILVRQKLNREIIGGQINTVYSITNANEA